jgi:hypothetical protein
VVEGVIEVETGDGLLCWDGRILEELRDETADGWRIHGARLHDWSMEHHNKGLFVRFYKGEATWKSVRFDSEREAALLALIGEINRFRAERGVALLDLPS